MTKAAELAKMGEVLTNSQIGGRRNIIINGAMQVAQRGTSASVSDNSNEGYATVDRFKINFNSGPGGVLTASQSTDAPDGFSTSLKLDVTTAHTISGTGDRLDLQYFIEGQDLQHLNYGSSSAENLTLSFYAKADTFSDKLYISIQTLDGTNNYYFKDFTPTSSWQRFIITIPKATSATIDNDNGAGLRLNWVLGATASDGASSDLTDWTTTVSRFKTDVGNILSSTDNNFYITGVQLEVGDFPNGTPFEHRSVGEELALCQRYFEVVEEGMGYSFSSSTKAVINSYFCVTKRDTPTITSENNTITISNGIHSKTSSSLSFTSSPTLNGMSLAYVNFTSLTTTNAYSFGGSTKVFVDSEL